MSHWWGSIPGPAVPVASCPNAINAESKLPLWLPRSPTDGADAASGRAEAPKLMLGSLVSYRPLARALPHMNRLVDATGARKVRVATRVGKPQYTRNDRGTFLARNFPLHIIKTAEVRHPLIVHDRDPEQNLEALRDPSRFRQNLA